MEVMKEDKGGAGPLEKLSEVCSIISNMQGSQTK